MTFLPKAKGIGKYTTAVKIIVYKLKINFITFSLSVSSNFLYFINLTNAFKFRSKTIIDATEINSNLVIVNIISPSIHNYYSFIFTNYVQVFSINSLIIIYLLINIIINSVLSIYCY